MIRFKRTLALILCLVMFFPVQNFLVLAEALPSEQVEDRTEHIDETLPLEPVEEETDRIDETLPLERIEDETAHIKETLPLEPLEEDTYAIYWNPGGQLPAELATASNATSSNAAWSKAKTGKDSASGLSPAKPVKTLAMALERANELMEKEGLDYSDITIYAMNPMEVADGELYVLNAGNIRIAAWSGRSYKSDALFYVNGGQLALMNVQLGADNPACDPEETELVYIRGGALQMKQNVMIHGCVVMDYCSEWKDIEWEEGIATPSNAKKTAGSTGKAGFNLDRYILNTDEDNIELIEDKISSGTWRKPVIELLEGFDGNMEYLLNVRADDEYQSYELVTTLYADDVAKEEFLSYFTLAETNNWNLWVETTAAAKLRDTGTGDQIIFPAITFEEEILTCKTLVASPYLGDTKVIYWNPGAALDINGEHYPAGNDLLNDGSTPRASLKTWKRAAEEARKTGGIVIAMQSLNLGADNADEYLERLPGGEFYLSSTEISLITSLGTWNSNMQPAIIVPKHKTLIVENLYLGGMYNNSGEDEEAYTILVDEGDLIIEKNVKTEETGYIQLNAFSELANHPIQVGSVDSIYDGGLRIYFSGINYNIAYRYVDVVIPGTDLEASIGSDLNPLEKADMVGKALLERVELHRFNRTIEQGGLSGIDWFLRQDTEEDDGILKAQNIELYTTYYYDAVYIDGVDGSDKNYGASCEFPVKTWGKAKEVWLTEMTRSLQAREEAEGLTLEEIEADFPLPEMIFICNTVAVDSDNEPEWELESHYDHARGMLVKTEIVSHIDKNADQEEGSVSLLRHQDPGILIKVTGNGVLSINNVLIRNMVDHTDSVTIMVEAGGTLNFRGETTLTGTRLNRYGVNEKALTLGNHVTVTGESHFVMETGWIGSIENREQGVVASGRGTTVEMNNGVIQKNNSFRADFYDAGITTHKAGGGVVLSDGARFTMNGGKITENETYKKGAGVYLDGFETTFLMNKGEISGNRIQVYRVSNTNGTILYSQGSGICGEAGTIVEIGSYTSTPEDTFIRNNEAYLAHGTGIYANGSLVIHNAAITDNVGGGIAQVSTYVNCGVGVYVGSEGKLTMKGGLVKGNHGGFKAYAHVRGAGIYMESNTNARTNTHIISNNSRITENETGFEYWTDGDVAVYGQGGGIFLSGGNTLEISDTTIDQNRAGRGGGIYAGGSSGKDVTLTIQGTTIESNKGIAYRSSSYGDSGGIYFYGYGTLTLMDGTKIVNNSATRHTGGLYIGGASATSAHAYMLASAPGDIVISDNYIISTGSINSYGGGVTHEGGSWHAENVLICNNKGGTQGGGIYSAKSSSTAYFRNMTLSKNQAADGAGLAINPGVYYMQDSSIVENTATDRGGGISLLTTNAKLYLSESEDGKFELKDNHADYGGGISIINASSFMMDIEGPIQNSADKQGSNFYLNGFANIDIFNGHFKQPVTSKQVDGVYNIYIEDTSPNTVYNKNFDFSKIIADKKDGDNPDVILLNSGSALLTVLAAPLTEHAYGGFPIDVNNEVFQSGSVVLKPLGKAATRPMLEPNANLSATISVNKQYSDLMDATENADYYRGGKLPRRSELGGFKDASVSSKTNVILVGQGVYLDGTDGNNNKDGTSPDEAVATFERAKEMLEKQVMKTAEREENLPEGEGFAPFIYICGQVPINNKEDWELNYEEDLFVRVNENYAKAEYRNNAKIYEPQVRRFASFVQQPMIRVDNGASFTLKRVIIDGMADNVVLSDQNDKSPVIYGSAGTHVTLTGDSMIRNNYYSAMDIYGNLILKGEKDKVNKQLYNNQSLYTVRLYGTAQMTMQGYARIITDATVEKVAGFNGSGIWIEGEGVTVSMKENSAIVQEPNSALLNYYLIYSPYANTTVEMKDHARLEVGSAARSGIVIAGINSKLDMSDHASIETMKDGSWTNGINLGSGSSLTMSKDANITYGGIRGKTVTGIYMYAASGAAASVIMRDSAAIVLGDTSTGSSYNFYGINVDGGTSPKIELLNNSKITNNFNTRNNTFGIVTENSNAKNVMISMNMEDVGRKDESVSINNMQYGIYFRSDENRTVSMGKGAMIVGCTYGIQISDRSTTVSTINILMNADSRICKNQYGIYFLRSNQGPINIQMNDHAAIEQNDLGISESASYAAAKYIASRLSIEMSGFARISGNSSSGIQLVNNSSGWSEEDEYQKITLHDNAVIGGSESYSSTDAASGNQGPGIYANGPIQVLMDGDAKISGNGKNDYSGITSSGIYLTRVSNLNYYRAGTARITLNDSASICDNKGGGVYAATIGNNETVWHNHVIIELNGTTEDGGFSAPSIQGNTDAIHLGSDTVLRLKGGAKVTIHDTPYTSSSYAARVIDNYGYIELDGRSTVKGMIYMNACDNPITMTHAATGTEPKYDLHLVEGFVGKIVVRPDESGIWDLTHPESQLTYFNKVSADGMAKERPIVEQPPFLVLRGENDVYLSGNGNDDNTGNTPSTPVRTFKRARELLQGKGYYETGANIIICSSTVKVLAEDEDWSFDSGGFVTNSISKHSWQPLVTRYKEFNGVLITLPNGNTTYAPTVTYKNITIDGGSANDKVLDSANELMFVDYGKTAILGEGAVLQNNKAVTTYHSSYTALGVRVKGGTLEINGGIIRNIVREVKYTTTNNPNSTSAVLVQGSSTQYPGSLIMKSGQIINNELNVPDAAGTSARMGTIYLYGTASAPCSMDLQGGLIEGNKVVTSNKNPAAAGAIINENGVLTISGGMIRGNEGGCGSAIFHIGIDGFSRMVFSGGQISGNTTHVIGEQPVNQYSPVYVLQRGFELCGGGANISDSIFLTQPQSAIKVTDHIYQTSRSYRIYLNIGANWFKNGSVVVEPDGDKVANVNSFLPYFDLRANPYVLDWGRTGSFAGNVNGVKEEQCLILMKAVFLDSVNGDDGYTGQRPSQAVKSFTQAKKVGVTIGGASSHYVIYICGEVNNTSEESSWTLPETAYMCRYTGFTVYESDGTEPPKPERAYYGCLIRPSYDLTFEEITIQGRRTIDSSICNGDSLVNILDKVSVKVEDGAVFSYNNNNGRYIAEDGFYDNLDSKGGAFQVAEGGSLTVNGGEIKSNSAAYGSAIYLHANERDPLSFGQLYLTGSPVISGSVYLSGTADVASAWIKPNASYVPSSALNISVGNDFNDRPLIQYIDGTIPDETVLKHYAFDDSIMALYDIVNSNSDASILVLNLRRVMYLDGENGSDDYDGTAPQKAFKTLKRTFEEIGIREDTNGVMIYIVGTLNISEETEGPSDIELMNIKIISDGKTPQYEGYYRGADEEIPITGQVYFKRYARPEDYADSDPIYNGYDKETLWDSLFYIGDGGELTLSGIYLDGHSISCSSINPVLRAPAVEALSPLITVEGTGVLKCNRADNKTGGVPTTTLFTNNTNVNDKNTPEYLLGELNDSPIMEGSSAGIELRENGTCFLEYTSFTNLALGKKVKSGGTDIYSNGNLHFCLYMTFCGSVFLEGLGTKEANQETSRIIEVDYFGTPLVDKFQVLIQDPYMGREVVRYKTDVNLIDGDSSFFLLEDCVKDFFYLSIRDKSPNVLELRTPVAVYIDGGENGNDNINDRFAGSTPGTPVKTLGRAFELLTTRGGNTIYVVGTIQVTSDIQVTGHSYTDTGKTINLGSTSKVNLVRYIKPDFAINDPVAGAEGGYDVEDFTGALLNVQEGTIAHFSEYVYFDGHSEPKTHVDLPIGAVVTRNGEAKGPLITVKDSGVLNLLSNVTLFDNNNIFDEELDENGSHGGAVLNSGTTTVDGALFKNNRAAKGSVAYQDGIFTVAGAPENLDGHRNTFYLTSVNTGSELSPVWGTDHVIRMAAEVPEHQIFDVDMDHPVKGREVVRFTSNEAFDPNADAEHEHFRLGSMVPEELFLVEAAHDPYVLELQNWGVLKVEIPTDIYLVVSRKGSFDSTNKLAGVICDSAAGSDLFTAPNYVIKNNGIHDVKVSITGFDNKTMEDGITDDPSYLMKLTADAASATTENELYLAVKGLDDITDGTGFDTVETSLSPYTESSVTAAPIVLGTLKTQTFGNFSFVGAVGNGFVEKYMDASFPIEGTDKTEVQKYMDGTSDSGKINARAKYRIKYKVEHVPPRR